ncbi:sigma-70 family RNA polymerase sigma factor [Niabella yanshanensis]|uniref:Sigma-70 family RNA polymerase sigma factor n=1 Tax=Niabella yanshanensis TaxID=577386 RepID=A0ABZ0W6G5_9BACT|nr:sigma-70 family RNA polymerase sigma factor [Niabella yanshanensis]WQD38254.1 sigma-70 family RNA polymerase sigma factor [Niabella yanshanensis]
MQLSKNLDDQELMELCRQGRTECFSELYLRYNKAVFNTILRLITDFAQAQDLLQEAFMALYQEIMKGREIQHFANFSRRVAANKAISFLRAHKRVFVFEDYRDQVAEEEAEDEDLYEMKVEGVKKAIEALPEGFRTIVNLYVMEGVPQQEIAELLGISHATVRTQYHRARKKILTLLQKETV